MILVTGGTGMLGSNLLLELTKYNDAILATKRENSKLHNVEKLFAYNKLSENLKKIKWVNVDLLSYFDLEQIYTGNSLTEVYHCAAQISYKKSDDQMLLDNNVESTKNVVDLSLNFNINKLCYVSSIASLGSSEAGSYITEETEYNTEGKSSGYSVSKYYAEMEVWRGIAEGLNAVIVNPSVILGGGDWNTGSASIFSTIANGLKFYTKGITGFVDVVDVAKIMLVLMKSDIHSERFIVNSENIRYFDLFKRIAFYLEKKPPYIYANSALTAFAWRLEYLKSIATGKQPVITSNSARTSHKTLEYSSSKLLSIIDYKYIKIEDSIKCYSMLYKEEN